MNRRYILPFHTKGAPNPSVIMNVELRLVTNKEHKHFGKYSVYTDSLYRPLEVKEPITLEDAEQLVKKEGCIPVKDSFNRYSIDDLREIKHLLPDDWIEGFNIRSRSENLPEI